MSLATRMGPERAMGADDRPVGCCGPPNSRYLHMLLIAAVTMAVTLLIGLQGERRGYDMDYKANTEKGRTHSLVRLGAAMLDHRPGCSLRWLEQLLEDPTQLLAA